MSNRVRRSAVPAQPPTALLSADTRRHIAESVATLLDRPPTRGERTQVVEAPTIVREAPNRPGRILVRLIRAGWSKNNVYYPAEVLRRDGPRAWPAGTLNFIDHATDEEDAARPVGSLTRLASAQTTNAYWDDKEQALFAEVRPFSPWREALNDWAASGAIGMSIRAWVYADQGEAEGRTGLIVSEIAEGRSVDYVTTPAAGGGIVAVLESLQRPASEARNVGAWLESRLHLALTQLGDDMYGSGRLTREERITLSAAIGDALQAWTARVEADAPQLFTRDIYDEPQPPVAATTAEATTVPAVDPSVTAGAPPVAPIPTSVEESMTNPTGPAPGSQTGQVSEATPAPADTADLARINLLESERNTFRDRATALSEALSDAQNTARAAAAQAAEAVAEMRRLRANEAGRITVDRMLSAAESGVPAELQGLIGPRVHAAIINQVPLTESGDVDQTALEAAVTAAIRAERIHAAALAEAQGVGRVAGLGASGDPGMQVSEAQLTNDLEAVFAGIGLDENVARLAAKGR